MLVLNSSKWTWTHGTPDELGPILRLFVHCPCGCGGPLGGTTIIERSNPRSVTLRCHHCGLHWTMTLHQLARAAARHVERGGWPGLGVDETKRIAEVLADLAAQVPETRGRKQGG